jgi:ABC-2 type transport system ATP-binding protein
MVFSIEIKSLVKKFKDLTAVDHLDLQIEQGEVFGLLGPNGAGKTTTLMMLTTLLPPTEGTASVNGFDITKQSDKVRKSIGIVFQDPSSDDTLTGYENLKLHAMLYGIPKNIREEKISEVLKLVDLEDRKKELVKNYSGGMRRRLEIARGLMHHPTVLFLDEPTLGLDPQTREHIWEYIKKLAIEKKMTIVLTTHYMEEADLLCNRVAIIDKGKIVALDTPGNLKKIIGGDVVRIKCSKPNIEAIRKLPYVKKVENMDGKVSLTVEEARKHLKEILEVIGKVESVYVREPTLNDVFLHYTGEEIRDTEAEGGWAQRIMNVRSRGN